MGKEYTEVDFKEDMEKFKKAFQEGLDEEGKKTIDKEFERLKKFLKE
jgi:hypothetical protein